MSHDLTHEQVVGAPKVRSSSKLAAINAIAAMASMPNAKPRRAVRVQDLRASIASAEERGTLTADALHELVSKLDEFERRYPGAELMPLDDNDAVDLEVLEAEYRTRERFKQYSESERARWPKCATGPCEAGPHGLVLPRGVKTRDEAAAILAQIKSTEGLRELTSREKEARRALRRQGIAQPSAPEEFAAIAQAKLRRLSKAAKRARHAQRMMEGNRAAAERLANVDVAAEVAC